MKPEKRYFYLIYILIASELIISSYLFYHHNALISGNTSSTDLCRILFSRGCNNALFSGLSSFLNVPMGGWGLIYIVVIGLLYSFSLWFNNSLKIPLIELAFWISALGIIGSSFFITMMIFIPSLFCPFCTVFHLLNFALFILLKIKTQKTFRVLVSHLYVSIIFLITGKQLSYKFKPIYWLAFLFPLTVGLAIFQWAEMEGMKLKINKLASYDPLQELIKFDSSEVFKIELSPEDPLLGSSDAPVELIVFSDFQCEMCQYFASNFKNLIEFNNGKLKIYFKYFPLNPECNSLVKDKGHALACEAAFAAEAAKQQGCFWAYHDSLFNYDLNNYDNQIFFQIAEKMNLNMAKFKTDFESESCRAMVKEKIEQGIKMDLEGTPSVFLNGHLVKNLRTENLNFLIRYLSKSKQI